MTINFQSLQQSPRLLIEASLQPVQGTRFQPTGFPDLGAAEYQLSNPERTRMVLVESAQSMANRLESVCWNTVENDWIEPLRGLPHIAVEENGKQITSSVQESHRINSPYILESEDKAFFDLLKGELGQLEGGRVDLQLLATVLLKYDINTLLHGVFLAKKDLAGGRLRLPRALSSFIEARNIERVMSGGVKLDEVDPKGDAKAGFGHVPFQRTEYAGEIKVFFNLDLAQIRGYAFPKPAENLLIAFGLFKISRFLRDGLRLRTACDLEVDGELIIKRPEGFVMPSDEELSKLLPTLIEKARESFAQPTTTVVNYVASSKAKKTKSK